MAERCEDLAFLEEAGQEGGRFCAESQELDRNTLIDFAVVALGKINGTHPTAAKESAHEIGAATKLRLRYRFGTKEGVGSGRNTSFEEAIRRFTEIEQRFDLSTNACWDLTLGEIAFAFRWG